MEDASALRQLEELRQASGFLRRILDPKKAKPEGMEFAAWFEKNEKALRLGKRHPKYDLYKYVAYQFYQVIQKDPNQLNALVYLNEGLESQALSTRDYLSRWKGALPGNTGHLLIKSPAYLE